MRCNDVPSTGLSATRLGIHPANPPRCFVTFAQWSLKEQHGSATTSPLKPTNKPVLLINSIWLRFCDLRVEFVTTPSLRARTLMSSQRWNKVDRLSWACNFHQTSPQVTATFRSGVHLPYRQPNRTWLAVDKPHYMLPCTFHMQFTLLHARVSLFKLWGSEAERCRFLQLILGVNLNCRSSKLLLVKVIQGSF